jgi:methylmalonyl-CoA mutase N-terminal domain/subunit
VAYAAATARTGAAAVTTLVSSRSAAGRTIEADQDPRFPARGAPEIRAAVRARAGPRQRENSGKYANANGGNENGGNGNGGQMNSESGLPIEPVYGPDALRDFDPAVRLGEPGAYPYTRGVYPQMYTHRPWTMRQYAGFATALESNRRYHQLIEAGTMGLSVAFDLPTQMGYDSDAPEALGEVGKVGVAIDSIEDLRVLVDGIPLDKVSTSMTINAPAAVLLLLYQLAAEENGIPAAALTGTVQNDVLKEYIARGTYIYPPSPSLRLVADSFRYCQAEMPRWNTISISGYHMAEAGATPVQEIAFTLANAKEYVRAAVAAGLEVDSFAARLSFFFVARTTLLEEIAKFRAARRIWARMMREEFGARNPKSWMLRFHTQTAGVQLTAQQPEVNLVRVAIQALGAVLGGTQSLHTNAYDEAIALPTEKAARLALRTQQVIAHETDLTRTIDPFAGSYAIERMTDDVEAAACELIDRVEELGGAVAAIEQGYQKNEIERSAYQVAREIDAGERVVVGVNRFRADGEEPYESLRVDPAIERAQALRLERLRAGRDGAEVTRRLSDLRKAAAGDDNVLYPLKEALRARATVGEVCGALREVWGAYVPPDAPRG